MLLTAAASFPICMISRVNVDEVFHHKIFTESRYERSRMLKVAGYGRDEAGNLVDDLINLGSNDYLGLALDAEVRQGAISALQRYGVGLAMNQPFATTDAHEQLKYDLCEYIGTDAALLFGSCTAANISLITTVCNCAEKRIVVDAGCHPSTFDGCRLAKGEVMTFATRQPDVMKEAVESRNEKKLAAIVTDGVFSINGVVAPLNSIAAIASDRRTTLIVDESHGAGVLGARGRGALDYHGIAAQGRDIVITGTFAKAFGAGSGGFIAGPADLMQEISQIARFYMFNTGMHTAAVGAALAGLKLAWNDGERRARLWRNVSHLHGQLQDRGFEGVSGVTPIIRIRIGDPQQSRDLDARLREKGFVVSVLAPPLVPPTETGLRVQVSARHTVSQLDRFCSTLTAELQ